MVAKTGVLSYLPQRKTSLHCANSDGNIEKHVDKHCVLGPGPSIVKIYEWAVEERENICSALSPHST